MTSGYRGFKLLFLKLGPQRMRFQETPACINQTTLLQGKGFMDELWG